MCPWSWTPLCLWDLWERYTCLELSVIMDIIFISFGLYNLNIPKYQVLFPHNPPHQAGLTWPTTRATLRAGSARWTTTKWKPFFFGGFLISSYFLLCSEYCARSRNHISTFQFRLWRISAISTNASTATWLSLAWEIGRFEEEKNG